MDKWRPEGWKEGFSPEWDETRYKDFEAGADAMLEAIWKMAQESPTKTFTFDANMHQVFSDAI